MIIAAEARRDVLARLATAGKSNRGAAGYSRWINRRVGRQIAAVAYLAGLTPNQVSALSALFTFPALAALTVFRPSWALAVLAAFGLLLGYAFDSADGQVARLRGGGSPAGEWLDHVIDALKISSFHLVLAIMWFRFYDLSHKAVLLIPLGFAVVSAVFFFALILADMLRRIHGASGGANAVRPPEAGVHEAAPALRSLIVLPNDYGVWCLAVLLITMHQLFIAVYAVLFGANTLFLLAGFGRWFREMSALKAPPGA